MSIESSINKVSNIRVFLFYFPYNYKIEWWPVFKQDSETEFMQIIHYGKNLVVSIIFSLLVLRYSMEKANFTGVIELE